MFGNFTVDIPMPHGAVSSGLRPPIFPFADGVEFYARDDRGRWFSVGDDGTWRDCQAPILICGNASTEIGMNDPHLEGRNAFTKDLGQASNPYDPGTDDCLSWNEGFCGGWFADMNGDES